MDLIHAVAKAEYLEKWQMNLQNKINIINEVSRITV